MATRNDLLGIITWVSIIFAIFMIVVALIVLNAIQAGIVGWPVGAIFLLFLMLTTVAVSSLVINPVMTYTSIVAS